MTTKALSRREFIATTAWAASAMMWPGNVFATEPARSKVWIIHGDDPARMLAKGIAEVGGWNQWIKPGATVALKPNAAWASTPEQGGNTTPRLVEACLQAIKDAGAKRINMPENPCSPAERAFSMSGIGEVAKSAGAHLYAPAKAAHFRAMAFPDARALKGADVAVDVLDCDCLINMPVAKNHGSTKLTAAMKNWMGSVQDRGHWHRTDLHQCIADFNGFIKPSINIVDATRIMLTKGPRGPGQLAHPNEIVIGFDAVAVDAYLATLFNYQPMEIGFIKHAHEQGIGCGDLSRVELIRLEA